MQITYCIVIFSVSDCPDGWEKKLEFGKCYYSITNATNMNWNEAYERCAALDPDGVATLTSVRSQEENTYVFSLLSGDSAWIGGTDKSEEGVWR